MFCAFQLYILNHNFQVRPYNHSFGSFYLWFPQKCIFKDIVQPKKRGVKEGYQSIHLDFVHNRLCFLGTLKGLVFCFK
jgi:hypothetical protein